MKFKEYLFFGLMALLFCLMVLALIGALIFASDGWQVKEVLVLQVEGVDYKCTFYKDGDMDCHLLSDPDVGGGWESGREAP